MRDGACILNEKKSERDKDMPMPRLGITVSLLT